MPATVQVPNCKIAVQGGHRTGKSELSRKLLDQFRGAGLPVVWIVLDDVYHAVAAAAINEVGETRARDLTPGEAVLIARRSKVYLHKGKVCIGEGAQPYPWMTLYSSTAKKLTGGWRSDSQVRSWALGLVQAYADSFEGFVIIEAADAQGIHGIALKLTLVAGPHAIARRDKARLETIVGRDRAIPPAVTGIKIRTDNLSLVKVTRSAVEHISDTLAGAYPALAPFHYRPRP